MGRRGLERGAAIRLGREEMLPATAELLHYIDGPVAYRHFIRDASSWLAVHEASHDGTGWLVFRTTCRELFLLEGDHVHCRFMFVEDRGETVLIEQKRGGMMRLVEIDRDQIVFIEEAASERGFEAEGTVPKSGLVPR